MGIEHVRPRALLSREVQKHASSKFLKIETFISKFRHLFKYETWSFVKQKDVHTLL